jgi:hemoglobin
MSTKQDILHLDDVKLLVNRFYEKVRADELLAPIFEARIKDYWPEHLEKMYRFWQTVLLEEHTYNGSPFLPHAKLPVTREHFERWMELFLATTNELFDGEKKREAEWRAAKMAQMFELKIEYSKQYGFQNLM